LSIVCNDGLKSCLITGGNATSNLVKGNATNITSQLNGVGGFINAVQPGGSNPSGGVPQAFLTVLFFDERFNFIAAADGGVAQQQVDATVGSNGSSLTLANIKAPKNGYAFIYISNQSNKDVYFDNLQVGIVQGNIAEENHYYSYGLKIAGLSSKKLGDVYEGQLKNNYLYQGAYSELDDDIGWHDFMLRNYDAQIGRWVQQDPYQEFASGYVGMGDDPINLTDPSGGSILDGLSGVARVAVTTIAGAIIGTVVGLVSGDDDFTGTLIGAGAGLFAGLSSLSTRIAISMGIKTVNIAATKINGPNCSVQAGSVNDKVEKGQRSGTSDNMINQILKDVLKLKTVQEAWEKGHSYPGKDVEYSFDVSEDEDCYYAENLDTKGLRSESPGYLLSKIGKAIAGHVHIHIRGASVLPSLADIYVLRRVVNLNPKFGNFILVIGDDSYYALVITDPEKAKKFYDDMENYNRFVKEMFDKNTHDIKNPKNKVDNEKKLRKAYKKVIRSSKRDGIRIYKAKDVTGPNFKRL
jgi:RHS repeat-associated protein